MSDEKRARAQALEAEGDADGAAREYVALRQYQEAARVLIMALRPLDAAAALLGGIDMIAPDLEPEPRSRAQLAASLLREGGREEHARLVLAALAGGPAFPSAVLRSTAVAPAPAPRSSTASAPGAERRAPSAFVVRAPARASMAPEVMPRGAADPRLPPSSAQASSSGSVARPPSSPSTSPSPSPSPSRSPSPSPSPSPSLSPSPSPSISISPSPPSTSGSFARPAAAVSPAASPPTVSASTPLTSPTPSPPPSPPTASTTASAERPPTASAERPPTASAPRPPTASASAREAALRPELRRSPFASGPDPDRHRPEAGWRDVGGAAVEETIKQFLASGRKGAAARVAWEGGQFERALPWFVELGLKYQAGSCLRSLGRPTEALAMLLEVKPDDTRYRRACFEVVALARETERLDFEVDRFLTPFVGEGPKDADECDGYLELAAFYASAGFAVGARRCAEGVLRIRPDEARAKAFVAAGPSGRSRAGSDRPARPIVDAVDLSALPSVDEFTALARKHAPPRPTPRR